MLTYNDSCIICINVSSETPGDKLLKIYTFNNAEPIYTAVEFGRGQGQLLSAQPYIHGDTLILHDVIKDCITIVDLRRAISDSGYSPDVIGIDFWTNQIMPYKDRLLYLSPYWTDDQRVSKQEAGDKFLVTGPGFTPGWEDGKYLTLNISAGKEKRTFRHVVAGEVWLCSGQSNMEFLLSQATTGKEDIPQANHPDLRLYNMKGNWATDNQAWQESALDSVNHLLYYRTAQWEPCTPQQAANFSAIAYYFGKMLQDSLNVPVGLICNAVGGSPTEAWIDRSTLEYQFPSILKNWTQNDFIQEWVRGRALTNMQKRTDNLQRHPYEPCYLYEAGIRTLEQYPIKGVIWYQGESNAHNMDAHKKLFRLLVESWRRNWQSPELPFYFVQLSSLNRPSWPWFRDSQRQLMLQIPHTGMVVSSDKGDSLDVHPRDKRPVGERLARWALNQEYGYLNLIPSGPLFKRAHTQKDQVIIEFNYGEGLQSSDGEKLVGFEIAETEGLYYPATAVIQGNQIILYAKQVKEPRFIRYGWQPFTRANLINRNELPASTFRAEICL